MRVPLGNAFPLIPICLSQSCAERGLVANARADDCACACRSRRRGDDTPSTQIFVATLAISPLRDFTPNFSASRNATSTRLAAPNTSSLCVHSVCWRDFERVPRPADRGTAAHSKLTYIGWSRCCCPFFEPLTYSMTGTLAVTRIQYPH